MLKLEEVVTAGSSKNRTTEYAAPHSHPKPNLAWLGQTLPQKVLLYEARELLPIVPRQAQTEYNGNLSLSMVETR